MARFCGKLKIVVYIIIGVNKAILKHQELTLVIMFYLLSLVLINAFFAYLRCNISKENLFIPLLVHV